MSISGSHVCCSILLVLVVALLVVTVVVPFWVRVQIPITSQGGGEVVVGMILTCGETAGFYLGTPGYTCYLIKMDPEFGWFEKCRWLVASGTVLLMLLGMLAMFNMCYGSEVIARNLGGFAFAAALAAISGGAMFMTNHQGSVVTALREVPPATAMGVRLASGQYSLQWGLYLELGICSLLILMGLVLLVLPMSKYRQVNPS